MHWGGGWQGAGQVASHRQSTDKQTSTHAHSRTYRQCGDAILPDWCIFKMSEEDQTNPHKHRGSNLGLLRGGELLRGGISMTTQPCDCVTAAWVRTVAIADPAAVQGNARLQL